MFIVIILVSLGLSILTGIIGVIAQYHWNCSEPDESGERYIPGIERDYGSNVLTTTTAGDSVNLYHVQNTDCYVNQEVTAIDFCYQYSTTEEREAVFN